MPYTPEQRAAKLDLKSLRAMVAQLRLPQICYECKIPMRPKPISACGTSAELLCDVCATIFDSLLNSTWFLEQSNAYMIDLNAMIKHKRQLLDADED